MYTSMMLSIKHNIQYFEFILNPLQWLNNDLLMWDKRSWIDFISYIYDLIYGLIHIEWNKSIINYFLWNY